MIFNLKITFLIGLGLISLHLNRNKMKQITIKRFYYFGILISSLIVSIL